MTRLLGIDPGSRRIGVAIGDTETGLAFARRAIARRGGAADLERIRDLAAREGIGLLVVGLPRNMDGSEGPEAGRARAFGERLASIGLAVVFQDERLTSWQAESELASEGRRVSRASGEVDSAAARILLQEYLDVRRAPAVREEP